MKIIAITQARFSSSRLPGKVLKSLGSATVLDLHLKRVKKSKLITQVVVATTDEVQSVEIEMIAKRNSVDCFHGSLHDVLDRYYQTAKQYNPDYVVRITSDCPLIDPLYIDDLIKTFLEKKVDYAANCINPTLPDGMDTEIFTFAALEDAWKNAFLGSDREHVTPFIRNNDQFQTYSLEYSDKLGNYRLTLDTQEDYDLISKLVDTVGEDASVEDYIQCLKKNPEWIEINSKHERNEGLKKSITNN